MKSFFTELWQMILESNLPGIIGALLVLLVGWFLALWLSRRVSHVLRSAIGMYKHHCDDGSGSNKTPSRAYIWTGRIVYWMVMILALLACMSLLHLEYAAVPLREFITVIAGYIPNVIGALLLLLAARILAGFARMIVRKIMLASSFAGKGVEVFEVNSEKSVKFVSQSAYFLVYLFFIPAILNALGIYGITAPLQAMFAVILIYLPRVIAAVFILFVGLWAARIIRRAVFGFWESAKLSSFMHLPENAGISGFRLGKLFGSIAWVLVVIPVAAAALTALNIEMLSGAVSGFFNLLLGVSGNIAGAVLVLLVAFIGARIAESAARKLSEAVSVDTIVKKSGAWRIEDGKNSISPVIGKVVFVSLMLLGMEAACGIMGFDGLSAVVRRFIIFGGNLVLSAIILTVGMIIAGFAAKLLNEADNGILPVLIRWTIIIFASALALSNLDIGRGIVEVVAAMIFGGLCLAIGLAFGLGGREFAAGILESWQRKLKKDN